MTRIAWDTWWPGTWVPNDKNEFCDCPLYTTEIEGVRVEAHKTKDGNGWIAKATTGPGRFIAIPNGKPLKTRKAAAYDAVRRHKTEMSKALRGADQ